MTYEKIDREALREELESLSNEWYLASMRAPEDDRRHRTVALLREASDALLQADQHEAAVRALLPGPRTFAESVARDHDGNLWPRTVNADAVAVALELDPEAAPGR